jgi:hypothetical protein
MLKVKVREGFVCWMSFNPMLYHLPGQEFDISIQDYWGHAHQLEIIEGDPEALRAVAAVDESAVSNAKTTKTTTKGVTNA